jgi:hypothetical protein
LALAAAKASCGGDCFQSMMRKSGNRFSDKIMLGYRKTGAQSVQLETIAL